MQIQQAIRNTLQIAEENGPEAAMQAIEMHKHKYPPEMVQKMVTMIQQRYGSQRRGPLSTGGM